MVLPAVLAEARGRTEALAARTGLGVGGRAEFFFEPEDEATCAAVLAACARENVPVRVLGGGWNLLVADGTLEGAVLSTRRLTSFAVHEDRVDVGAGHPFPRLVRAAVDLGIPALPGCPGIPGSVGGVVAMNAGGRFGCAGDALLEVRGLEMDGRAYRRAVRPSDLGYRTTAFEGTVVTGATFRRDPTLSVAAQRATYEEAMAWKRSTQPLRDRSAGCIFKNPDGPTGPRSAGRLIDAAGLKGRAVGGAEVSPIHANFIVNRNAACAADVFDLVDLVRRNVRDRHGVDLALEVKVWR